MTDNEIAYDKLTDDELLSAYLDGELPAGAAAALESRLAAEPELVARLNALTDADLRARDLYKAVDAAPMPTDITDLLQLPATPQSNVVELRPRPARRFFQSPLAIAASIAIVAGILVTNVMRESPDAALLGTGMVAANSPIDNVLDDSASGVIVHLEGDLDAEVVLSFEDTAGRYCRQLRLTGAETASHGVACRAAGGWNVEAVAEAAPGAGTYGQAGSAVPEAIEAAVDGLIGDNDVLDAAQENAAISNTWGKTDE